MDSFNLYLIIGSRGCFLFLVTRFNRFIHT
nr:hypothetical protein PECWAHUG_PECWAHUG_CDS_0004 [Microvirus sp.]